LGAIRSTYNNDAGLPAAIASKLVDRLGRSELSKAHVSKLLRKPGVTGRTEAINMALQHGIVTIGEVTRGSGNWASW
jgi:hypothetical protein